MGPACLGALDGDHILASQMRCTEESPEAQRGPVAQIGHSSSKKGLLGVSAHLQRTAQSSGRSPAIVQHGSPLRGAEKWNTSDGCVADLINFDKCGPFSADQ